MTSAPLRLLLWSLLAILPVLFAGSSHAAPPHVRRIAIVIGSNAAPPGRTPLRFARDDANLIADTLRRVGRFAPADVHVLLEPSPEVITRELSAIASGAAGQETLFVFYYSGHSDGQAVFPGGQAMLLSDLRSRLEAIQARVLVGIMDTCRGGAWTQAKGLSVGPPLDPVDLMTTGSEGTALVSSSSGSENAHEAQAVQGSFFTHYLASGLLGAADLSGDGTVTLHEAFEYARGLTIRDSARMAPKPQHPSFEFSLRGRQDVVLAQLASAPSALDVQQTRGPLEVIQLSTGVTVAEITPGARRIRLALPPGNYLIRKVTDGKALSKEIAIPAGGSTTVAEDQLELVGTERIAMKGAAEDRASPMSQATSLPRNWWELRLAAGVTSGPGRLWGTSVFGDSSSAPEDAALKREVALQLILTYAITDRLEWTVPLPAFSYRFGDPTGVEVIPRLGVTSLGYANSSGLLGTLDAGVSIRGSTGASQSLLATLSSNSDFNTGDNPGAPTLWSVLGTFGGTWTLSGIVSLNPALGFRGDLGDPDKRRPATLVVGSVQSIGYRLLPLVAVHLSPKFALELHAAWSIELETGDYLDRYLAGFAWNF